MANDYYTHGSTPSTGSPGSSSVMRAEFDLVMAGFAKLPGLTGNGGRALVINSGGTAITLTTGAMTLGGAFITAGGHSLTLTTTATSNVTFPTTGTLATRAGAETLTNKTLTSPSINTPTIASPTFSGTYTIAGDATIATTVTSGHAIGTSVSATVGLGIAPTLTGAGSAFVRGVNIASNLTGGANDSIFGVSINTQVTKAGSGTHSLIDGLFIATPSISGSATASVASTVRISGAPASGATALYALNVEAGTVRLGSTSPLLLESGQLSFPATANPSSDVNTLDEYEEGTWTPSLGGTATYSAQQGVYVKVGKIVMFKCFLTVTTLGTGSNNTISGLPFTAANNFANAVHVGNFASLANSVVFITGTIGSGSAQISMRANTGGAASIGTPAVFGNSASVTVSGWYEAAS